MSIILPPRWFSSDLDGKSFLCEWMHRTFESTISELFLYFCKNAEYYYGMLLSPTGVKMYFMCYVLLFFPMINYRITLLNSLANLSGYRLQNASLCWKLTLNHYIFWQWYALLLLWTYEMRVIQGTLCILTDIRVLCNSGPF